MDPHSCGLNVAGRPRAHTTANQGKGCRRSRKFRRPRRGGGGRMTRTLSDWLKANDLGEFEPVFVENQVDLKALQILTDSDLSELGLPFGPRKRILNAITRLKDEVAL